MAQDQANEPERVFNMYKKMLLIRAFEEAAGESGDELGRRGFGGRQEDEQGRGRGGGEAIEGGAAGDD